VSLTTILSNMNRVTNALVQDKAEPVKKAALKLTARAKKNLQAEAASSGYRAHSIAAAIKPEKTGSPFVWRVVSAHTASQIFEFGSGIFGPEKKRITPKNARVLHFDIDDEEIFVASVEGRPPTPFFRPAYEETKKELPEIMGETLWEDWEDRVIPD
jgi:HK97 gp10 family phage protein